MTILIVITVYVVSGLTAHWLLKRKYKNDWSELNPDGDDVLMTIVPIINTCVSLIFLVHLGFRKTNITSNKFFGIEDRK